MTRRAKIVLFNLLSVGSFVLAVVTIPVSGLWWLINGRGPFVWSRMLMDVADAELVPEPVACDVRVSATDLRMDWLEHKDGCHCGTCAPDELPLVRLGPGGEYVEDWKV